MTCVLLIHLRARVMLPNGTDIQPGEAGTAAEGRSRLRFESHHAFIIGIDRYQQIAPLQTAVSDARRLAEILASQHHFQVHEPLLDATGDSIRRLLRETLPNVVKKDDRVLFYFAGHGIAADGDDGPAGYIVPADADRNNTATFIAMEELQKSLDALPCRHMLLILDCCFSGAFKWSTKYRAMGALMPKRIYRERFDRFIEEPAWQVITSAAYDQKALDVLQGKATGERGRMTGNAERHSPFALALFRALEGEADVKVGQEGDGVITATEVYAFVRDVIEPATLSEDQRLRQTPGFFPLRKHDKGEFIFLHPRHRLNLPPVPKRSPYKGLDPFAESDKELFYGRDRVISELREKIKTQPLLVVSGASGTGKSSVVNAGLLPVLRNDGFRILPPMRPGSDPMGAFAKMMSDEGFSIDTLETLAQSLTAAKAVVVIDQYEELVTRCVSSVAREEFLKMLAVLLERAGSDSYKIIITVRADFEPEPDESALTSLWNAGRCTVPQFSIEELKEVIVMPTMQEVLLFDPQDMVDDILQEVVQSPGAVPLLSYTLSELYEAYRKSGREDRALKKDDYERLGGVAGMLRSQADALYERLDPAHRSTMRKILLRMVAVKGEPASKRVLMNELEYPEPDEASRVPVIVEQLVDARLVVKGKDFIEPAHDALVRTWTPLLDWVHEIGEDKIRLYQKVSVPANDYTATGNARFLWNDNPLLAILQAEVLNPSQWMNTKEMLFVRDSVRRRTKRRRIAQAVTGAVTVVLSALTAWALWSRAQAVLNARKAEAAKLTVLANSILPTENTHAVRIAEAAYDILGSASSTRTQKALSDAFHSQDERPFYEANFPHREAVNDVEFSPDGQLVLSASEDGTTTLWTLKGEVIRSFGQSGVEVFSARFSPGGQQIMTIARDSLVRLWDIAGGLLDSASVHYSARPEISPDGKRIVTESEGTRQMALKLPGKVAELSVSPDSTLILARSREGHVTLYDAAGKRVAAIVLRAYISSASFQRAGSRILTTSSDSTVRVWSKEGAMISILRYTDEVTGAALSPDGRRLLISSKDHTAKLWNLSQSMKHRFARHTGAVYSTAFSPDGKLVLTASHDNTARLWDMQGNAVAVLEHSAPVNSARFSPDGKFAFTAARNGVATVWSVASNRSVVILQHDGEVTRLAWSPADGHHLLTVSENGRAFLWSSSGKQIASLRHRSEITSAEFSSDGKFILTASRDSTAALWSTDAAQIAAFAHAGEVYAAAFMRDGERILTVSADSTAQLWQRDGKQLRAFKHTAEVTLASVSPDGRFIATAAGMIVRVSSTSGDSLATLAHRFPVTAICFSPDGELLLTSTSDDLQEEEQSAMLWNLRGELLVNYGHHTEQVNAIAFAPDGRTFVTASSDRTVLMWLIPSAIDVWLKSAPVYRLTPQEERGYEIVR